MKLVKQIPTQSSQRNEYTPLHVYSNYPHACHCLSQGMLNIRCIIILQQLMLLLLDKMCLQLLHTKLCFLFVYSFSVHLQLIDTKRY